ncbi:MAG: hypothetical protein GY834_15125 [Bacteroidetes bacterium]|nr:hypothetical protein [Bacteroidota bacterium]
MTSQPSNTIETIGTIEKKETLISVDSDHLVLESLHPFPGYHGTTVPDQTNPKSLFLVMRSNKTEEAIIRITAKVRSKFSSELEGSPGVVSVFNRMEPCIRIKNLKSYALIPELISSYKGEGISFIKGRKIDSYYGAIKIKKNFILSEVNEGIYMDKETPEMGYFEIPTQLDWDLFEKITIDLKHNIDDNNFDVALGTIYRNSGLIDIIRVYNTNVCLGECLFLREKYNAEIAKHIK